MIISNNSLKHAEKTGEATVTTFHKCTGIATYLIGSTNTVLKVGNIGLTDSRGEKYPYPGLKPLCQAGPKITGLEPTFLAMVVRPCNFLPVVRTLIAYEITSWAALELKNVFCHFTVWGTLGAGLD